MQNRLKGQNFWESGRFENLIADQNYENHITDFWANPEIDEIREIFGYEIREMQSVPPLHNLVGVEMR